MSCIYYQAKTNGKKITHESFPANLPDLEEPWPIFLFTKAHKIARVPTTDVSKFAPDFMLQMDFSFFNVESIRWFTLNFVAIYSATSRPFIFPSRIKILPLDTLKFIFTTLKNQDKKVVFIRVDEDKAISKFSEFMNTYNNMNIIGQTIGGGTYSINGKSKIPNKTLANIKIAIILNSSNDK